MQHAGDDGVWAIQLRNFKQGWKLAHQRISSRGVESGKPRRANINHSDVERDECYWRQQQVQEESKGKVKRMGRKVVA
jgi:hypothetical protein